ncbi:MAG: TetR/AcrR family transcriptional regulator [Actinobacteria bacterium]|nr:TetR/AcrR family transcriptional regulator [Actinomycetota bacterium]
MPRIRAGNIAEHKELTRMQILGAAQILFHDLGYQGTSLADIAAKVGIGRTTLYEYFTDKEDLVVSLVELELPKLLHRLVQSVDTAAPYADQIAELARGMVEFVGTDPTLGLILHRDIPKLSRKAQRRVRGAHAEFTDALARIYGEGVEAGELRAIPVDLAGRFLQDLIMSAAKALIVRPDPADRMQEVTASMEEFLLHGLSVG